MVPTAGANARGVAQAALDLVGQYDGRDDVPPAGTEGFGRGDDGGNVVAWVSRLQREVSVVAVQVPDHAPVREGGQLRQRRLASSPDRRASVDGRARGHLPGDPRNIAVPGAERATYGV